MTKSIIYLGNQHQITVDELAQADQLQDIPYLAKLDDSAQVALTFAWQWLQGETSFQQSTSGSTGKAKAISIGRKQMIVSARMTLSALHLSSSDTALLCLHPRYIGGKMMIVRSLLAGMDMVIVPPSADPLQAVPFLPDFAAMVPLQIQSLIEQGKADQLNQMKAIIVGGAPVSTSLEQKIAHQLTLPVYSTYGMTETVSHIALRKLTQPEASQYFQVLGGAEIKTDDRGCLMIKGEITQQQWLTTNDLIEICDERHFQWLGRFDFVINSGGVKVSPETVETTVEPALRAAGFAGRFLITSLPDERLGERVILLLEGEKQSKTFEQKVLGQAAVHLSAYQVPKQLYYTPALAETPSGKIQRQASRQRLIANII
uniref:AMP-binding protein n=1 Tax=Roseihalotalea indica TaxID=2867963 RepID=A0AA49JK13_9BACT|nr:AMP-binding protein [Tunicatimonas sp. TK19036]